MAKPLKSLAELKAETLAQLEKEKEEHKKAEEKKAALAAAQAKKNKEADLVGAKDAPKFEKVPAKSSSLEKASASAVTKNNTAGEAKQNINNSAAKKAGAQSGIQKIEDRKNEFERQKNIDNILSNYRNTINAQKNAQEQAREQQRLLTLDTKDARDKKYSLEQELAKLKEQAKVETTKAGTASIVATGIKGANNNLVPQELQSKIAELEKQISDLEKDINLSKREKDKKYLYNAALSAEDFAEYSKEPEIKAEEKTAVPFKQANQGRENETLKGYMNEKERAIYNYYYNKVGAEKAEEFLASIEDALNYRQAQAIFAGNEGKTGNEYIQSAAAGLESAKEGYKGALKMLFGDLLPEEKEFYPTSTFDYVSQMAREDLGERGIKLPEALGGASLGQIGFDLVNTTANMMPSMLLGTLGGGAVGAAAIGASAGGNAYNEAMKQGYNEEQAANYAALVGGSEAVLGYVLGGIEATGGKLGKAAMAKLLPKIDNALAKAALNVGSKMFEEFTEEYLQEVLTPFFGNIALLEDNQIDLLSPEAIYSGIMGALSAGGIAVLGGNATAPEALQKAEAPIPFGGKAQPGTEAELVANKISEIENRPISEAEKAAAMEKVVEAAAQNGTEPGLVEEVEKFKNIHEQNAAKETRKELSQNAGTFGEWILLQDKETIDTHTPEQLQTMFEYDTSVDPEILNYIKYAKEHPERHWEKVELSEVSNRAVDDIKKETGIDTTGFTHWIDVDFVNHTEKRHGESGEQDHSMADDSDLARVKFVIDNYDDLKFSDHNGTRAYRNADGSRAKTIVYQKAINGTYYIVEAVPDSKAKKLHLLSAYISTKKEIPTVQMADEKTSTGTPEARLQSEGTSNFIISPVDGKSNPQIKENISKDIGYNEMQMYEDTVPSFVRADINRIVDDPSITNEQKFYDLMALYDSAKTPAEKSEIGRYIYQMKTMPTERKPFFGIKNQASSLTKKDTEQNATFVPERGIETPEGINLLDEEVETNVGNMPVEDYREILAMQNGFDSYEQMQAEARALEEQDRKEEEWRKEQADVQMREITQEGRSRRSTREEAKAEHGVSERVSAEIYNSAKNVMALKPERPKQQTAIERRFLRAVEDGVSSVFGIDRSEIKSDIRPILEEMAADIKNGNKITDEQIEKLYKTAFDNGYITEEFPQYDETRKYIREHPIYVSQENRNEFGEDEEFYNFMRSNYGSIKVTTDPGAIHLDEFYDIVSNKAQDWFDSEETDPKTQLESIADFMQQTKKQYKGLSELYFGSELADFENWAKDQLKAYMEDFGKGLDTVARYERDRQIKAEHKAKEMNPEASFEQAKAAFAGNKVFNLQKELEKVKAKHALNDNDVYVVKSLLAGTMNEADVLATKGSNVEGILEVYNAEKAYKEARAPFDRYAIAFKQSINHDAINALERSDEFKDKKGKLGGAALSIETAERNVRDIAGSEADKIIENYFNNVHEHEAMSNRFMTKMNQRVKDLEIGKMNRWERAYAQMIGENAKYIAMGKITKHNQAEHDLLNSKIQNLLNRHGNKIDKEKCEKAAAGFMGIYQDIFEKINDERIRVGLEPIGYIENYFPHFVEAKPETVFQKFFSKVLGMDVGDSKLPTDIAGKTADRKPGKKWNPHTLERKGDVTDYDILKGFDGYLRLAAHNIYHTEDIKKLRALSETIRTKYASTDLEKRIEKLMNNKTLSEADRSELIQKAISEVPDIYHLSNFVVWLDEYTNILAGKKSYGDRDAEYLIGREVYDVSKAIEGRIASNMVGYNLTTPFMNTIPLFQATADIPPQNIISSVVQTGIAALKKDSFISDNSDFITNRLGTDTLYKQNYNIFEAENMKDFVAKVSDGGGFLMGYADRIVSESLVRARYEQNIKNGMDKVSAFSEADQWAAGLIADRSLGAMPTIMNRKNPIIKAFTMFQLEQVNQYSYIFKDAGIYKWKKKGAISTISGQVAFWIAMALAGDLAKELLNKEDAVPNPVGITKDVVQKVQKGEKVGNIVLDTATNIVKQIPYVGGVLGGGRVPVATALPDWQQLFKIFDKEENVSWEKKQDILVSELLKPMSYILFPSGAGQFWKTRKGIGQLIQGGAYGIEADGSEYLKFPQKYDAESIIKTLVFGQYGSDAGQNYIDSGFKDKLSAKQTEQMKYAEQYGMDKETFYNTVLGLKDYSKNEDKKLAIMDNEDLSAKEKGILDYVLFGKPNSKAAEVGYVEPTRDYTSKEAFYTSGLSEGDRRLYDEGFSDSEIKKINKAIGKGDNKVESVAQIQKALDCTEAEAFEIYQKRKGTWTYELSEEEQARAQKAFELYSISNEKYLTILNYSKYGVVVTNKDGKQEFSDKKEDVVPNLAKILGVTEKAAGELYDKVNKYEYSRADIDEETLAELDIAADRYEVDDKGYFTARNVIKTVEGEKDEYGNTVSGSAKEAAVKQIALKLNVDEEEATIYYLAAKGELILSKDNLTTPQIKDLEAAVKEGWTEQQFMDAVNIIKITGASTKAEILKTLQDAGASYSMAQGYYNLTNNKDYYRKVTFKYGMKNQKQEYKGDYFLKNYNDGSVTANDIAKWYAAASGCSKKQEYIDAYMGAGATYSQATAFYKLIKGNDKGFEAWYKENGG